MEQKCVWVLGAGGVRGTGRKLFSCYLGERGKVRENC